MTRRYEVPSYCPTHADPFTALKTRFGTLRMCPIRGCTMRQWLDAKGYAKGTVSDLATRTARMQAHEAFDEVWRSGLMSRGQAYAALAKHMRRSEVHMAEMNPDECRTVVTWAVRAMDEEG